MSDEFGAGVQILLKRLESNPDEFKEEYGKWAGIRDAVFAFKERGDISAWLRGLTLQEIDALYEKLSVIYRNTIDEWVMKQVLDTPQEERASLDAYQMAQGKRALQWNDHHDHRMYQNALKPGSLVPIRLQSNTTIQGQLDADPSPNMLAKIKKGLGL
jgi:hypothetical protein